MGRISHLVEPKRYVVWEVMPLYEYAVRQVSLYKYAVRQVHCILLTKQKAAMWPDLKKLQII
jgi:cbb3-type cytochrome oxidase cytochrome c subunit